MLFQRTGRKKGNIKAEGRETTNTNSVHEGKSREKDIQTKRTAALRP